MAEIKNIEILKETREASPEIYRASENKISQAPAAQDSPALPVDLPAAPVATAIPESVIILEKVENILASNLDKVFLSMDAAAQSRFKQAGEQTAQEITGLFGKGKATAKNIINLIVRWLRFIPKVNKHFLEQEAKIKTDAILKIYNHQ